MAKKSEKEKQAKKVAEDFLEEKDNKKFIVIIAISLVVVFGLILGSVYYFKDKNKNNNDTNGDEDVKTPVIETPNEEVEEEEVKEEEPKKEVVKKPVVIIVPEEVEKEEEPTIYNVVFLDSDGSQIGEIQSVENLDDVIKPNIIEVPGYTAEWVNSCDENNSCIFTQKYNKILVTTDEEYEVNLNGSVIEVQGSVYEAGKSDVAFVGTGLRSYVKIKFIAPDGITKEQVQNMSVKTTVKGEEGGNTYNGISILDSSLEEIEEGKFYFILTQAVDEGKTTLEPEIIIDWGDGVKNTYTIDTNGIEIISYASQIGIEKVETEEEKIETGTGDVTYEIEAEVTDTDETEIKVEGEVNYYETKTGLMELMGLDTFKNILTIKFTAPLGITDYSNLKVTMSNGNVFEGEGILDGENYFYLYQAVDPGTTDNPKIIVDWDTTDSVAEEVYIINTDELKLTPSDELDNTVEEPEDEEYEQNLVVNHDGENIIDVSGNVPINEETNKNEIETIFKPMEGVIVDKDNMTVTDKDGNDIFDETKLEEDEEGNYSYTHTQEVDTEADPPSVNIDWNGTGAGGDVSYEYNFNDVTLESPPIIE